MSLTSPGPSERRRSSASQSLRGFPSAITNSIRSLSANHYSTVSSKPDIFWVKCDPQQKQDMHTQMNCFPDGFPKWRLMSGEKQPEKSTTSMVNGVFHENDEANEAVHTPIQSASMTTFNCRIDVEFIRFPPVLLNDDSVVFDENDMLKSISLATLMKLLMPTSYYVPDKMFTFASLLGIRLLVQPGTLLSQLCKSCLLHQQLGRTDINSSACGQLGRNVVHLLKHWTRLFPMDFSRETHNMHMLLDLVHRVAIIYPELRNSINKILSTLYSVLASHQKFGVFHHKTEWRRELSSASGPTGRSFDYTALKRFESETKLSPEIMAQQLTHIEIYYFSFVEPNQLLESFAQNKKQLKVLSMFHPELDSAREFSSLDAYINWFNRLSACVASAICSQTTSKQRAETIEFWLEVARQCLNIGNYNSLMSIMGAMNKTAVSRLQRTWRKVSKSKYDVLQTMVNPCNNFANYRAAILAAKQRWKNATYQHERIIIPVFSIVLKDLFFYNETIPLRDEKCRLNFAKFWTMAQRIAEIMSWQRTKCPFPYDDQLINLLTHWQPFSEHAIQFESFRREGAESSYEKRTFKALKSTNHVSHV